MVEVHLWSGLRQATGGETRVEVEGSTVGDIVRSLVEAYPGLEPYIEAGVSVAVDGRIIANDLTAPVNEDSEVYLIQQLKGG